MLFLMKIAILSPFYPYRGGIAQFSAMLFKELEKEHEVKAFSFSRLYPDFLFPGKTQYVEEGDQALAIPGERLLDSINPLSYHKTLSAIKQYDPDVLIISYWMSFFAPSYQYIARRLKGKTKIIALVHNAIPHEPSFFDKPLARFFFKQIDSFIAMSDSVKKDIMSLQPSADIKIYPHPLYDHYPPKVSRTEAIKALKIDPDKKTLLFFGLIRDYKGLDLLIDAMDKLDSSYQLLIAGECYGSFDKYQKQIDQSTAKDRLFVFNQYIEDEKVPVFFSAADLLVLPYKSATQSGVIPVAYHYEIPVIVTDAGGLKDTVSIPETGLVSQANALSLAHSINLFFEKGAESFIQNIRKEKEKLSWKNFVVNTIKD